MRAANGGHEATAALLLGKGADVNAAEEDGTTPLMRAANRGHEATAALLLGKGADVNAAKKDGCTPLMLAAEEGKESCVDMLLASGARINASNKSGLTAAMLAIDSNQKDVAARLLNKEAYTASCGISVIRAFTPKKVETECARATRGAVIANGWGVSLIATKAADLSPVTVSCHDGRTVAFFEVVLSTDKLSQIG